MILKSTLFLGILSSVLLFPLFFENEVQAQTIGKDSISFKGLPNRPMQEIHFQVSHQSLTLHLALGAYYVLLMTANKS